MRENLCAICAIGIARGVGLRGNSRSLNLRGAPQNDPLPDTPDDAKSQDDFAETGKQVGHQRRDTPDQIEDA